MSVTFDLPQDIETELRAALGDLNQAAKEAALVELYRQRKISHVDFSRALGLTRIEAEDILKKHCVVDDLPDEREYREAMQRLRTAASP